MKNFDEIKKNINNCEVISFDIFDTLLFRPFVKSEDTLKYLAEFIKNSDFYNERIKAEKRALMLAFAKSKNTVEAVTISEIYDIIKPEYKQYKELELKFEEQILTLNDEMFQVYNYAVNNNKKVILTSDMYLPKDFLVKVLKKNGIQNYFKLYVSSDIKKTKATGNLYKYICNDLNILPRDIFHIGDNENSDYKKALENGLKAYLSERLSETFFKKDENTKFLKFYEKYSQNPVVSAILGLIMLNSNHNYWYNLGYSISGPLALEFVKNVIDISKKENLDKLLFIARDTYCLNKIYSIISDESKNDYVYVNRKIYNKYFDKEQNDSNEFYKYIKSINLCNKKVGVIDTCAKRFSAQALIEKYQNGNNVFGIYLIVAPNENFNYVNLSNINWKELKLFNWNFIEFVLTSYENPICDISGNKPVYIEHLREEEIYRNTLYKDVLKGELEFAIKYKELFNGFFITCSIELIFSFLNIFWRNMSTEDKANLTQVKHPFDDNQEIYVSLVEPNKDMAAVLRKRLLRR